jgi:hypothetical protein
MHENELWWETIDGRRPVLFIGCRENSKKDSLEFAHSFGKFGKNFINNYVAIFRFRVLQTILSYKNRTGGQRIFVSGTILCENIIGQFFGIIFLCIIHMLNFEFKLPI